MRKKTGCCGEEIKYIGISSFFPQESEKWGLYSSSSEIKKKKTSKKFSV